MSSIKVVMTSDTHEKHRQLIVPDGDIFIHSGDFSEGSDKNTVKSVIDFNNWLGELPHKHKVIVAGNHDFLFEKLRQEAESLITNATYLRDKAVTVEGLKIYGSPWQPYFCNWAFNLPRDGDELRQVWSDIPDDTDILVTHGPPYGIRDWVGRDRVGDKLLLDRVLQVKPLIHVFGHIHAGAGYETHKNGTVFVNAAACDEAYKIKHDPTLIYLRKNDGLGGDGKMYGASV
jgi:Icc-related predicted phosphoesterase